MTPALAKWLKQNRTTEAQLHALRRAECGGGPCGAAQLACLRRGWLQPCGHDYLTPEGTRVLAQARALGWKP